MRTFHPTNKVRHKLATAVIINNILMGSPKSISWPKRSWPGATLTVATAVDNADTLPSLYAGTSFCINVKVSTFDSDKDNIIAIPHNAKATADA